MRVAFTKILFNAAKRNKKIMLLAGDLGYSIFEPFIQKMPKQFINAGVAEQNMTGMAAGLAIEGKIPVIYSIIPFATMRNFEQIRDDICYQNLNVKIVGVGSGFSYGAYGHTHHGLEDIGILRTLANLIIFSPSDPREAESVTKWALKHIGPVYIRLGKAGEPILNPKSQFEFGKGSVIKEGKDVTIFSTGSISANGLEAANALEKMGISTALISVHTIKPIDQELIIERAKKSKYIFTLEEHSVVGGLGSAVAEVIAENNLNVNFKIIGAPDRFTKRAGRQEYMREVNGLSSQKIVKFISKIFK